MTEAALQGVYAGFASHCGQGLEGLLAALAPILPLLDAVPNTVFFIKDAQARYLAANLTLAQRCGFKSVQALLGKTSAQVFPAPLGARYTAQDHRVLHSALVLQGQLELHLYRSREPGWCLTHKRPLLAANGEVLGMAGISVDLQATRDNHPAYQRLAAVDDYIRDHYNQPIALERLMALAGMSAAQLERYCKRIFHLTPRQMIHKVRLEHAHRLLLTAMPITEVALLCGYTDHSAFSRQFKALTGVSPSQYRGAMAGNAAEG
ncbi:helix-turn-helix transcriptional regulator [Pseudomonas typographi]|uniref:AraC family transcriptional regulator n=1 Tax=Pseudomonas typographi TaxID=2715964 RepID=A0ABR7YWS3_9PSED|nr:AraC family transcriptional regulator [Pseudomonas typographi]MBD1554877.1 AraC family transcriptional regulator [Pseudomonas typographi]MBD1585494.1 AraC family transcriptional regulator [Pseudomonas typographi]MBD1597591.1 AraC family transcriptional regulator [Pseudomonas typographi]